MAASKVSPTEIGYSSGVTSAIQTQVDAKAKKPVITVATANAFTTSSATYVDVTGLTVTITSASTSDYVHMNLSATGASAGTSAGFIAYSVDGAAGVCLMSAGGAGGRQNLSASWVLTGLSAGSHTIKIQLKSASGNWTITGPTNAFDNEVPQLSAIQFFA